MTDNPKNNIIQLDKYRQQNKQLETPPKSSQIVRIASELDGMEALYNSDLSKEHLFSVKILFWALLDNGDVCAVLPWLKEIVTTHSISSISDINKANNLDHASSNESDWQGYYDTIQERMFFKAPDHKVKELELAHQFYAPQEALNDLHTPPASMQSRAFPNHVQQELPDHLGTHAAFKSKNRKGFYLKPIISWQLTGTGQLQAMVPKQENPDLIPLPGSSELAPADNDPNFRYYFQHGIATRIKQQDPNAMTVVSLLIDLV